MSNGTTIHPQAIVHADCFIGAGVKVWQFASVIRGAAIGHDSSVGSCAVVDRAVVGSCCSIGHGAQVHPGTVLLDHVFVGPGAIICNDMWPAVSKDGFSLPFNAYNGPHIVFAEDGVSIGAGAIILPGVRLFAGARVAAGAVVDKDVPAAMMFRRDGSITVTPSDWKSRRMRFAREVHKRSA